MNIYEHSSTAGPAWASSRDPRSRPPSRTASRWTASWVLIPRADRRSFIEEYRPGRLAARRKRPRRSPRRREARRSSAIIRPAADIDRCWRLEQAPEDVEAIAGPGGFVEGDAEAWKPFWAGRAKRRGTPALAAPRGRWRWPAQAASSAIGPSSSGAWPLIGTIIRHGSTAMIEKRQRAKCVARAADNLLGDETQADRTRQRRRQGVAAESLSWA